MPTTRLLSLISVAAVMLSGCNTALSPVSYEPIPGSITYKGQPRSKLNKVPIGSTFTHEIQVGNGDQYIETYQVRPDRDLTIIRRVFRKEPLFPRER
jgi:hypothetical protein